jgi:hypothetical protein
MGFVHIAAYEDNALVTKLAALRALFSVLKVALRLINLPAPWLAELMLA